MRKALLTLGIIAAGTGVGAALAQTVDGLDLGAIQRRADAQAADAAILSDEVARRAKDYREDAETIQSAAMEKVKSLEPATLAKGPKGPVDFDELVASAASNLKDNRGTAPQFTVFVSLSMPEQALRQIINETSAAGGFVVFRGFPNNSGKQFIAAMSKVVEKDDQFASIGIDPRLFRAFNITAVPTYVAVSSDFSPCDGLACKTTPPPFDSISGNVTTSYALQTFSDDNGPGALVARAALKNLRGAR